MPVVLVLVVTPRLRDERHERGRRIGASQRGDLCHGLAGVRGIGRERAQAQIVRGRNFPENELRLGTVGEIAFGVEHRRIR
jgi:hypothetical protein